MFRDFTGAFLLSVRLNNPKYDPKDSVANCINGRDYNNFGDTIQSANVVKVVTLNNIQKFLDVSDYLLNRYKSIKKCYK